MTWREIVNDIFLRESGEEVPVTVTYCPLCNSALAYDRRFRDRILDFGTSGELFQSDMVMYDRQISPFRLISLLASAPKQPDEPLLPSTLSLLR
jgi:hypothetical protein